MNIKLWLPYYTKKLSPLGYTLSKSRRNGYRNGYSYYYKSSKLFPTIRLSDHDLHPNQLRDNIINIKVYTRGYKMNDVYVNDLDMKVLKKSSIEYIMLELSLFKNGKL